MIKLPEINETQKEALIAHCKECLEIVDRADANIRKSSKYQSPYLQNLLVEHQTQRLNYLITLSYLESPKIIPDGLHQSTAELVIGFATALAEKLHLSEQKYGWSDGWKNTDWQEKCLEDFNHHIDKGDPHDVAAYCAFMWFHGWQTQRLNATAQPVSDDKSSLLTYLNECSEQVSRWPEWKKKGSDVTALIKEMDDFEIGFVNGWTERHRQPVSDVWVKCSDRMPVQHQSNRYVPLNLLLNERTVVQGGFDDGEFWMDGVVINNVTRWMPLPAAPGGQDD